MYMLYVDESGKSGLHDLAQPFHVLGGLAIDTDQWLSMEADLNAEIDTLVPPPRDYTWELHMTDMWSGSGLFKAVSRTTRRSLWEAVLDVVDEYEPTLIFTVVDKQAHIARYGGNADPPEDLCYLFMIERFNHFLGRRGEVGVIISDDQKGSEDEIRKTHSGYRRDGTGYAKIEHVMETPFFAPSHWSRMLQVVDVLTWFMARGLKARARGESPPPEFHRLERHLDGHPNYMGRGLKMFP